MAWCDRVLGENGEGCSTVDTVIAREEYIRLTKGWLKFISRGRENQTHGLGG